MLDLCWYASSHRSVKLCNMMSSNENRPRLYRPGIKGGTGHVVSARQLSP